MNEYSYLALIPLLPLASFLLLGLFGRKYLSTISGWIGTASLLAACILSFQAAWQYFFYGWFGEWSLSENNRHPIHVAAVFTQCVY
jgi:NADH:ubiquinone oxidoreductase subunit 5 (subunit L)/multisubunit Na+/H+ antiporter MnhA subunit